MENKKKPLHEIEHIFRHNFKKTNSLEEWYEFAQTTLVESGWTEKEYRLAVLNDSARYIVSADHKQQWRSGRP